MSDTDIFLKNIINRKVKLSPDKLHKNFKQKLLDKLKDNLENKYSKYGLIKENSIEIIKYSIGTLEHNSLQGNVIYNVQFSALVCNPVIGNIIKCKVFNLNNFGILCKDIKHSIIEIIVPKKTLAIQSDIPLNNINIDDIVFIEIIGKKPLLNDKKINCIGKIKRANKIKNNNDNKEKDNTILLEGEDDYDDIVGDDTTDSDTTDDENIDGGGISSDEVSNNGSLLSLSDLSDNLSDLSDDENISDNEK
tara:strand:- start:854 stop:1600 length:747 start_codon:yes stop_codon:yes gene_type:complete